MLTVTSISRCSIAAACLLIAIAPTSAQRGPSGPDPIVRENATEKISDHVYVIPDFSVVLVPNIGIIVGSRGTLVIDTGLGTRNGQIVMREVAKVSKNAQLYVASTHVHPEHDLGADAFPPTAKMIRSEAQTKEIADSGLELAKRFASFSPATGELLKNAEFRKADISFADQYVLDLGGVRVRLTAEGPDHTPGDIGFFVEPDRVLFSGDIAMSALPAFGQQSSVEHWLGSLDRFEKLQPTRIVPSHGPMGDVSFVTKYRAYFQAVRTRVVALKKEGRSLEETVQTVTTELQTEYPANRVTPVARAAYSEAK